MFTIDRHDPQAFYADPFSVLMACRGKVMDP